MTEDDIYRASTQYRLWSYTPESLASLRAVTNASAASRVTIALQRARSTDTSSADSTPIDCLTPHEAHLLVQYYGEQCLRVADAGFSFPTSVKATAVAYLQRFYLANSPMTYHPRTIFPTCLYLATKTENNYTALAGFAAKFKSTPEAVIAPEFVLTQGLRFTFDVRHPHRGLRGGLLELLAMARATPGVLLPGLRRSAADVQAEMMALPPARGAAAPRQKGDKGTGKPLTHKALEDRCGTAHDAAKATLGAAAPLTDTYFLYTPAQIWLAALLLADEPLALFYLETKFPRTGGSNGATVAAADGSGAATAQHTAVLMTIRRCADMLGSFESVLRPEFKAELVRIDKKLYACLNPERAMDVAAGGRRRSGERDEERASKKRKLERERSAQEGEDVFGGPLVPKVAG